MSLIPEFIRHAGGSDVGTTLQPFTYDAESKTFVIADHSVELGIFEPYDVDFVDLGLDGRGIDTEDVGNHPLYIPILPGRLIVTASLHEWAQNNTKTLSSCWEVIRDAYMFLGDFDSKSVLDKYASRSHIGFASGLREFNGIHLQTMGNCACMGPMVDGNYLDGQFEHNWGEYDTHNADTQRQRASLFAGMGHLAQLCADG